MHNSLYLLFSCLVSGHFWASATHDKLAVLGAAPICCYSKRTNLYGYASTLQIGRNLATHSSSSTSTCHHTMAFLYDIQANQAMSGIDSRLVSRMGFSVDTKSKAGISVAEGDESQLKDSVDSRQAAMNLGASSGFVRWDLFVTLTNNQSEFPGTRHLHEHKQSLSWTAQIPEYDTLPLFHKEEIARSMELAYSSVLGRCWMEARKLVSMWCSIVLCCVSCGFSNPSMYAVARVYNV